MTNKNKNTVLWILGIGIVLVIGYFIYANRPLVEPTTLEGYNQQLGCEREVEGVSLECDIGGIEFGIVKLDFSQMESMGITKCTDYTEKLILPERRIETAIGIDVYRLNDGLSFCSQKSSDLYIVAKTTDIDDLSPYFNKYYSNIGGK